MSTVVYKTYTLDTRSHAYDGGFTTLVTKSGELYEVLSGPSVAESIAAAKLWVDALADYTLRPSALPVPVAEGGSGATTAAGARSSFGIPNHEQLTVDGSGNVAVFGAFETTSTISSGDAVVAVGDVRAGDGVFNQLEIAGSATGNPVELEATGVDSDISIHLKPKGAGLIRFGTHTASSPVATGYVTILLDDGSEAYLLATDTKP